MIRAPRGFVHTFTRNCQNTWQSNVEAAHNERDAAIARAEAAERRVAELEAPATWRHPIADNPAKELQDTAMCELIVIGEWDTEDDTWSVEDLVWFSRYSPSVTHWRPLPLWRRGE